jgi:hypothetical protein
MLLTAPSISVLRASISKVALARPDGEGTAARWSVTGVDEVIGTPVEKEDSITVLLVLEFEALPVSFEATLARDAVRPYSSCVKSRVEWRPICC